MVDLQSQCAEHVPEGGQCTGSNLVFSACALCEDEAGLDWPELAQITKEEDCKPSIGNVPLVGDLTQPEAE